MIKQNLHTHSNYCDGKCSLEEMILSAIQKGYDSIGFSSHIKTVFPSVALQDKTGYFNELKILKEKYADKIKIYIGGEFDLYSTDNVKDYDYTIGSVHFDNINGVIISYDTKYQEVIDGINKVFDGDVKKFIKAYFEAVKRLPDAFDFDIVGHLDIVTKHNLLHNVFDENDEYFRDLAIDCAEYLISKGKTIFEVNFGGIKRGYKTYPYPAPWLIKELVKLGAKFIITSDAHDVDHLIDDYNEPIVLLKSLGVTEIMYFDGKNFVPQKI